MFRVVASRSKKEAFIRNIQVRAEQPTPFAFLMSDICEDLQELARIGCCLGMEGEAIQDPNRVAQLPRCIEAWATCLSYLAMKPNVCTNGFREELLVRYLDFLLQIGFWPRDALIGMNAEIREAVRFAYRDLIAKELAQGFGGPERKATLDASIQKLDGGKMWVQRGIDWLRTFVVTIR
jgi:hypothetical protein